MANEGPRPAHKEVDLLPFCPLITQPPLETQIDSKGEDKVETDNIFSTYFNFFLASNQFSQIDNLPDACTDF